jgi:hypothetical protein
MDSLFIRKLFKDITNEEKDKLNNQFAYIHMTQVASLILNI